MDPSSVYEDMVLQGKEPKRLKMKDIFSKRVFNSKIKTKQNNIVSNSKMVKKVHSKTREQLNKMKVGELKALVRKHNLHNAIKGYSKMKKAAIVEVLMTHSRKPDDVMIPAGVEPAVAAPPKRGRGRPKKIVPPPPPPVALDPPTPVKRGRGRPKRVVKAPQRLVER